ncbi:MAG TPA: signal peptidase I [Epsilonproteobacteria bacterium]|nr:signal peptidase I [Campylobacterota bacterium]
MKSLFKLLYRFASSWTGTIIIVLILIFFVAQSFVIPSGSMKRTLLIGDFLFAKKYSYGIPTPHLPWLEIPVLPDFNDNGHLIDGPRPKRGEIVIFRKPQTPKIHFVKRCVAVGGDEIIYADKQLLIHFHEGDNYIQENYPPEKIQKLNGKLWVKNPYKESYRGISYNPESATSFEYLLVNDGGAMEPILVAELDAPIHNIAGGVNALYTKVPQDHFYMVGDNRDNSSDSRFWGPVAYRYIVGKPWAIYFSFEWRSYDLVLNGSDIYGNDKDHTDLRRVCGDIALDSQQCKKLWDKERFRVRWHRIGKSIDSISEGVPIP